MPMDDYRLSAFEVVKQPILGSIAAMFPHLEIASRLGSAQE
jgi:hypothetical protein